jgi:hypothetical protein
VNGKNRPRVGHGPGNFLGNRGIADGTGKLGTVNADGIQAARSKKADVFRDGTVGIMPNGETLKHRNLLESILSIIAHFISKCKYHRSSLQVHSGKSP